MSTEQEFHETVSAHQRDLVPVTLEGSSTEEEKIKT